MKSFLVPRALFAALMCFATTSREFADHTSFKTINQIQLLDVPGDVTKGEILR